MSIEALLRAVAPFAALGGRLDMLALPEAADDMVLLEHRGTRVTVADLRRMRAAFAQAGGALLPPPRRPEPAPAPPAPVPALPAPAMGRLAFRGGWRP